VVVTVAELEALEPRKSRDIDIRDFVDQDQIEPLYFERSYFLVPAGTSNKAYRLLASAMEKQRQAGIATFVLHDKEYLVALISERGILRAETLRFADEVRRPEDVGLTVVEEADSKRVAAISREIEKLKETRLKPSLLEDEHSQRLQKLIERKRKRHQDTIEVEEQAREADEEELDIMEVLKKSLQGSRAHGGGHRPARRRSSAAHRKSPRHSPTKRARRKSA
jgi:DNA end-binding protein Ku